MKAIKIILLMVGFFQCCMLLAQSRGLTTEEYISRGMPSPTRVWTGYDYMCAVDTLVKLVNATPDLLPHKSNPNSGELFDRLVSSENLTYLADTSLDVKVRLQEFLRLAAWPKLLGFYFDNTQLEPKWSEDVIYLSGFACEVMALGMEVMFKFRAEYSNEQVEKGYAQSLSGLVKFTKGSLMTLGEEDNYNQAQLVYFSGKVVPFIQKTWKVYDENTRQELRLEIRKLKGITGIKEVREALASLDLK